MRKFIRMGCLVFGVVTLALATGPATSPAIFAGGGPGNGSASGQTVEKRLLSDAEIRQEIRQYLPELGDNTVLTGATCAVLDPNGNPVTSVPAASFGDPAYWLHYEVSGQLAQRVEFVTMPLFTGSPLHLQVQRFSTDFSNSVSTPFGIPQWGANKTAGTWALIVRDNLGRSGECQFEVTP